MLTLITRRRLRQLEAAELENKDLHKQTWLLSHQVLTERSEKGLIQQARDHYEELADYWKHRAELFIDQIGLRHGTIVQPTMQEPPAPVENKLEGVFGALGIAEINHDKAPSPGADSAAPRVEGVNPEAAKAAVEHALARPSTARIAS